MSSANFLGSDAFYGNNYIGLNLEAVSLNSFTLLPEDTNINSVLGTEAGINTVITEVTAAAWIEGAYVGSLQNLNVGKGYWTISDQEVELEIVGNQIDPNFVYNLNGSQWNLISYPFSYECNIEDAIADEYKVYITEFITKGKAAVYNEYSDGYLGSLNYFEPNVGYWVWSTIDLDFSYNQECENYMSRPENEYAIDMFNDYNASINQGFYYIEDIDINLTKDNIILIECNDELVGSRQWTGLNTDIAVMGNDGRVETENYCEEGDIPKFYVYDINTNIKTKLNGDIPGWGFNSIHFVSLYQDYTNIPNQFIIENAYPNPFNPITNIDFGLSEESHIIASIYDISGRLIEEIKNDSFKPGYHSIVWDASNTASGIYILKIKSESNNEVVNKTQKLILLK